MPTFNLNWGQFSPGRLLLEKLIEWCVEHGFKIFDFTGGGEKYKKDWCNGELQLYERLYPKNEKGWLFVMITLLKLKLKKKDKIVKLIKIMRKIKSNIFNHFKL